MVKQERRSRIFYGARNWLVIGICGVLLCGCGAQPTSDVPLPSVVPTPTAEAETLFQQFLNDKGLMNLLNTACYEFSHQYELDITEAAWVLTDTLDGGDIVVNLINSEITFAFPDVTIEYKKKDRIIKTAIFSAQLMMSLEGNDHAWRSEIVTEDHQRFPIQFDPQSVEIQDAEVNSKTLGEKMNFAPSLYGQCLSYFKRYWNQSLTQQRVIQQMMTAADKIKPGMDLNELTVDVETLYDQRIEILEPEVITPDITLEVYMNFNDADTLYLPEASKLQKTLYLFTVMNQGFDDPDMIDWEALAPVLMSVMSKYYCDGRYCMNAEGQVRFADFAIREGYGSLVTQPDMNKAAKVLTGQDYVYDDYDNRKLSSGVVYSQSVNSYVAYSHEGDWIVASPGVIVLEQKKIDNRITVDFVTYVPKWDGQLIVEGIVIDDDDGVNKANSKIIETVKDNLDQMPHWTAELEDTGDEHFYRLVWAVRY